MGKITTMAELKGILLYAFGWKYPLLEVAPLQRVAHFLPAYNKIRKRLEGKMIKSKGKLTSYGKQKIKLMLKDKFREKISNLLSIDIETDDEADALALAMIGLDVFETIYFGVQFNEYDNSSVAHRIIASKGNELIIKNPYDVDEVIKKRLKK